ncbi:AAA family ATPase [Thiothrix sp.]|uniref:AAA family ATPase n=1 Tax=Thiothrix sp. TaxID=1032 RepID=UPI00261C01C0|nr:AAA family ATPase [Thiothrix sp.]
MSIIPRTPTFGFEVQPQNVDNVTANATADPTEGLRHYAEGQKAQLEITKIRAGIRPVEMRTATPDQIVLEVAMQSSSTAKLEYLIDPWLPSRQVVGFYGRGQTAKSSFLATQAARISDYCSTLWVSTEELTDWIKVRHIKAEGVPGTLLVFKAIATKHDESGHATASTFDVYQHLDASIVAAKKQAEGMLYPPRPLRFVVLDTAVALTTWGKSESPNSDAAVKRLFAFLQGLCEKHDVTIGLIGHSNKGKHEELTDSVAGSAAWVNSPRQAFTHIHDKRAPNTCVVCTVKSTLTGDFAASYSTRPIHTLATRAEGMDSVLCTVDLMPIEWGYQQARALVEAARGDNEEQGESGQRSSRKTASVEKIVTTVAQLFQEGVEQVDRPAVEARMGCEPSRRHWQEADNVLALAHKVKTTVGAHGRIFYRQER